MTMLNVLKYPDPFLRKKAKPVKTVDVALQKQMDDMLETMYTDHGAGLAATQVGLDARLFVADASGCGSAPMFFINPKILEMHDETTMEEGCLSFPGIFAKVKRFNRVKATALNYHGKPFEIEAEGLLAQAIQHELEHLDGVVFIDHLSSLKRKLLNKKLKRIVL
jgi:peptide deformylase